MRSLTCTNFSQAWSVSIISGTGGGTKAAVVGVQPDGSRVIRVADEATRNSMALQGCAPLPPYIHEQLQDESRYQTVYSGPGGSAAAPTAGLHFSDHMLAQVEAQGIHIARLTLHVGIDTFMPVREDNLESHVMHGEWYQISEEAANTITRTSGRVIAVGTTVARALESAWSTDRGVRAGSAITRLFITPGFRFNVVNALLTNFHLPKSTLLMLVSAFAGRDAVLNAYQAAIEQRVRFYSFGDAMFIY